jgi:6-phosphogluconolactonase/glucosamine-6-phosphate isomerase/deaminase
MEDTGRDCAFTVGLTTVSVERDAAAMGKAAASLVADAIMTAAARGEKPALWLMAAPSGFAFYEAFVALASKDRKLATICREATWYQFDDYPIGRGDPSFPVTFRHLLESRFFKRLTEICGSLAGVRLLEIGEGDDERVSSDYARMILDTAEDPASCLIQLKGIGMDGHWAFHGSETPLDAPPAVMKVAINDANIHQQKIDWPEFFREDADVPAWAWTCNVSLLMKAKIIVDCVPQASKMYSVLATYGNDMVTGSIPSSAIKSHSKSHAFLTRDSASALLEYRRARDLDPKAKLSPALERRLEALWEGGDPRSRASNIAAMRRVLRELGMLAPA